MSLSVPSWISVQWSRGVASETRLNIARAANRFDAATTQVTRDRAAASALVLDRKQAMARELGLLDFERQMQLHRRRAQDLHAKPRSIRSSRNVVRARDAGVRTIGDRRSSFVVQLEGPANVRDRDAAGVIRPITQTSARLRLLTTPGGDEDAAARKSSARAVHNVCPSGPWVVTANAPDGVDDLLFDLDIAYFGA